MPGEARAFAVGGVARVRRPVGHPHRAVRLRAGGIGFHVRALDRVGVVVRDRRRAAADRPAALGDEFVAQVDVVDPLVVPGVLDIEQLPGAAVDTLNRPALI